MRRFTRKYYLFAFTLVCLLTFSKLCASNTQFDRYSIKEGLSHTHVLSIYQDSKGFIWFGTYGGLHLFNGSTFQIYTTIFADTTTISANAVNVIFEDNEGLLWFGTEYGLNKYNRETGSFTHFLPEKGNGNSISHQTIKAIFQDSENNLWIGTYGGGLNKLDLRENRFVHYSSESLGISNNEFDKINTLLPIDDNLLWVGTEDGGIFEFHIKEEKILNQFEKLNPDNNKNSIISCLHRDQDGDIWAGTWTNGLFLFDARNDRFVHQKSHNQRGINNNENIRTIAEDTLGNLWLAHFGEGLTKFNKRTKTFTNYYYDNEDDRSISSNFLWSLLVDKNNILWAGTFGGGLNKSNLSFYEIPLVEIPDNLITGSENTGISTILEDHTGVIWIGTLDSKVFTYNIEQNSFSPFEFSSHTERNPIHHIYEDANYQIWIGTDYGLFRVDSNRKEVDAYKTNAFLNEATNREPVNHIFQDSKGNIWLGTNNAGLQMLPFSEYSSKPADEVRFIKYKFNEEDSTSISSDVVNAIQEDVHGNIWVGTLSNLEILDINTNTFKQVLHQSTGSISIDDSNTIWVGTFGGGFYKLNLAGEILEEYLNIEGSDLRAISNILNTSILGMVSDSSEEIWLTTDNGISVYNKTVGSFHSYSLYDELRQHALWVNSLEKTASGAVLVGGLDGFNIIWPDMLNNTEKASEVYFSDFKLLNKSIVREISGKKNARITTPAHETKNIELSYKDRLLTIEFISLEHVSPQKIKYAYRLNGFDEEWIYTNSSRPYATYSSLKPGEYEFVVKASNTRGLWSDTVTRLNISVTPPFWQTIWFRALILSGFFLAIVLIIKSRTRTLQRQKNTLELLVNEQTTEILNKTNEAKEANEQKLRFFTSMSHEFRTPLTLILGPIEHLKELFSKDKESKYYLSVIQKNAFRLLRLINEILDLRRLDTKNMKVNCVNANIVDFISDVVNAFHALAYNQKVLLEFSTEISSFKTWFDPGKMEIIFYNLLSNALHHTPEGGKIVINFAFDAKNKSMRFVCSDTGTGISSEQTSKIFERFYQADTNTSPGNRGTGIGLSLIKEIIELLDGNISVSSSMEEGTSFKFQLPIINPSEYTGNENYSFKSDYTLKPAVDLVSQYYQESDDIHLPEFSIPNDSGNKKKLLIVEDDKDLRNYVRSCLNNLYEVYEAHNGIEGLAISKRIQPSIIISDIMMPEMNGIEFCSRIKEDLSISHIPVILLSARNSLEIQLEGYDTGADAFIPKPFSKKYLITRVNAIVSGREKLRNNFRNQHSLEPNDIAVSSVDEKFIIRVKEIIEKNICNSEFGVADLVNELGISRSLVYTKFKELTNCTTSDFIKSMRLKRACQLLKQKKHRVSEVAYLVGFNDPHIFSKTFKKAYDLTPTQYAQQHSK